MVFFNLFRARNAPSEITKDSESMKDSARELNIFTGLQRIIPVIRRMTHVEASMLLIPDYYSDDIVTFSFSNTDTIYIRVVDDNDYGGLLLKIYDTGKSEWVKDISSICKENILLHLESIIAKYEKEPTNDELYCKKVQSVVDETYVEPVREYKEPEYKEPETVEIIITVADKVVTQDGCFLIFDTNKSVYYPKDHMMFNSARIGVTYKCKVYAADTVNFLEMIPN